jgi:DNA-3-methyladenine glycosylase II
MSLARAHLSHADPELGAFIGRFGPLPRQASEHGGLYDALLSAIAHQQLHANAAKAILGRLRTHHGGALPTPAALLAQDDLTLRACGFSAAKMAALRDVAAKALDGTIPTATQARRLPDDELITRLTTIRGVGRWTVEMLLIFTLKRPDVLPVDDFGVREGYRLLHGLNAQPRPKLLAERGQAYAPYRSTAARYLWQAADQMKPGKSA